MNDDDFQRLSFAATIAYGLLAAFGLILSGLWFGSLGAAAAGLVCAGTAYLSQLTASHADAKRSGALAMLALSGQAVSLLSWAYGLFLLLSKGA